MSIVTKSYNKESPYNGIIQYITDSTKSNNIHKDGIVKAQFSSSRNKIFTPLGIDFVEKETYFYSNNNLREWYSIDFVDKCIEMSGFVMSNFGRDYSKEMRIDWSNDGIKWEELDTLSVPNVEENTYYKKYFNITNHKKVRMIRFMNTKERYKTVNENKNTLVIFRIEVFGRLYLNCQSYLNQVTCRQRITFTSILHSFISQFLLEFNS